MIICIDYDNKRLTLLQAFDIIRMSQLSKYSGQTPVEIKYHGGTVFKVTITKSKLVEESYTIEQVV